MDILVITEELSHDAEEKANTVRQYYWSLLMSGVVDLSGKRLKTCIKKGGQQRQESMLIH